MFFPNNRSPGRPLAFSTVPTDRGEPGTGCNYHRFQEWGNFRNHLAYRFREFSHPDWLPRRGIQCGIPTFEKETLRDIALERQLKNN